MKCDYCSDWAIFRLYHRDGSETVRCRKCKNPETVFSISKLGLEFKNDYSFKVVVDDSSV